ncbi:MAG: alpha/beta hydrolase [Rhodocyclaceae bacterium]|nr:alpha/beta hydrolase [Rhodocyclaceae bacterium]
MYAFRHTSLSIAAERVWLDGLLAHAPDVRGLVVQVQNGCILHADLRETVIATRLQEARFATLSVDLLTRYEEQRDPDARYNVPSMAARLLAVLDWVDHQPALETLPVGVAASGTTCGAAVRAAAKRNDRISALVCRSGRPDLAGAGPLRQVHCPTRFIVAEGDPGIARYQQPAFDLVPSTRDWQVVDNADEHYRRPGTLEQAARLTVDWFERELPIPPQVAEEQTHDA